MERAINHQKPNPEAKTEVEQRQHTITLRVGEKEIGSATMTYYGKPAPFYHIHSLEVEKEERGLGHGSAVLDSLNDFLKKHNTMGLLENAIHPASKAQGMYERHGWVNLPDDSGDFTFGPWYAYNIPDGTSPEKMGRIIRRANGL